MDNSWIKLYRKLGDNEVMLDDKALRIFIWLLLHVDKKTGAYRVGRFMLSESLKINPNTVYKALKRLEKIYKIVTLSSNNKYTTISLLSWAKYQPDIKMVTPSVTTKEQQSNNKVTLEQDTRLETRDIYNYDKSSNELSKFKKTLGVPEKPIKGISKEFQAEAIRIAKALGVKSERYSAYFKAVKEESRVTILDSYAFAQDHPTSDARDKMFFWKLNKIKNEKS